MRTEWGRRYSRKAAEDAVERTNKAAGLVDPDSTTAQHPEHLDIFGYATLSDRCKLEAISSDIKRHVRSIAPPEDFCKRGRELIGTQGRRCLRWPGQRSFCKLMGQGLGGPDAAGGWQWLKEDRRARGIVASRFVETLGPMVTEAAILGYVEGPDQLLDPNKPQRWGLLQAVASELHGHATKAENERDQATRDYHLGVCWAWCRRPPLHHRHRRNRPHHAAPDTQRVRPGTCGPKTPRAVRCGRSYSCAPSSSTSARRAAAMPASATSRVSLLGTSRVRSPSDVLRKMTRPSFRACIHVRFRACIPVRSPRAKAPMPRMPILHAGMHWLRDEGFQGLWADARERLAQPMCPLCRQPVNFGRAYRRGSERGAEP